MKSYFFTVAIGLTIAGLVLTKYFNVDLLRPPNERQQISMIELEDSAGNPTKLSRFRGQWILVMFGYTSCPDVCPTHLAYLAKEAIKIVGDQRPEIVFISVDPKRDRGAKLKSYVEHFDPSFHGWTGRIPNLQELSQGFGTAFQFEEKPGLQGYLVHHSVNIYLIDPAGRLVESLSPPFAAGDVAQRVEKRSGGRRAG